MLTLEEMVFRLVVAMLLGAMIGLEREFAGKDAGLRTDIAVASGAAIFAMISIVLPYIVSVSPEDAAEVIMRNSGALRVVSNVVVGIGFLGTGIIIKQKDRVRGLTTAATVWFVAAVGVLVGIGLIAFAAIASLLMVFVLLLLRRKNLYWIIGERYGKTEKKEKP